MIVLFSVNTILYFMFIATVVINLGKVFVFNAKSPLNSTSHKIRLIWPIVCENKKYTNKNCKNYSKYKNYDGIKNQPKIRQKPFSHQFCDIPRELSNFEKHSAVR